MTNSLSIFARALASENLSFSFDREAQTASFDIENRHLVMPIWDVSETVQTMLVAHEIAHALWTPHQRSKELLDAAEKEGFIPEVLHRIANIVEDVRIEKLMKDKYPGTRRDFFLGYKEINEKDMFGFSKMDFAKASLINRINIHFKWGVPGFIDLNLSADEKRIVASIDGVTTFDECIAVAKILYQHPDVRKEIEEYAKAKQEGQGDPAQGLDSIAKEMGDGIGKKDGQMFHDHTVIFTGAEDYREFIIPTSVLREDLTKHDHGYPDPIPGYRQFVKESDAFVRQLVAQFERRKAADEIRRERPKQTGNLNLDKLHQYRTHDDIFLSKIIKQDGKNHGVVFLLDMSGSMAHSLKDCFLQILQLTWFCDKAKIPYEVFGFTDCHGYALKDFGMKENPKMKRDAVNSVLYYGSRIVNLVSSRDTADEREWLLSRLYQHYVLGERDGGTFLRLGGTPTVEALAITSEFMVDWVKANNIQIPTIMLVTDGSPNGIVMQGKDGEPHDYLHFNENSTISVMDEVTGYGERINAADYPRCCLSNVVIKAMLNGLRHTLNARCVGMFVGPRSLGQRDYINYCMTLKEQREFYKRHGSEDKILKSARYKAAKESYEDGCIIVHDDIFPGFDSFFLVKTPKIVKDADAVTEGNFTKVKNAFVRTMGRRSTSRVFLTRYIDIVAGQPIKGMRDKIYNHPAF